MKIVKKQTKSSINKVLAFSKLMLTLLVLYIIVLKNHKSMQCLDYNEA